VAVITKMDLAEAAEFDSSAANKNIQSVRPGMPVLRVSAKTGEGMEELLRFLASRVAESRLGAADNQLANRCKS
jgi:hydrogenase nickel incorporation protein HypB